MWKEPPYIKQAVDLDNPWAKKYLELVSRPDNGMATEVHHIVPVAFYEDVLGVFTTRKSGTPDMIPENLVKLSRGHHLLAHYYLYRCARPCIKAQMSSAVKMMFGLKDLDIRLSELTEGQAMELADALEEASTFTGWRTRKVPGGLVGKYYYDAGKPVYGLLLRNGKVRKYVDHVNGFAVDEGHGEVSAWMLREHVVASTTGYRWNRRAFGYEPTGIAEVMGEAGSFNRQEARAVLTFLPIVRKFYPKYTKQFDGTWDSRMKELEEAFPGVTPAFIPDIPVKQLSVD